MAQSNVISRNLKGTATQTIWPGYPGAHQRTVADGATNSNTTVTSATAAFDSNDVGRTISGGSIPAGTTIASVTNATTVVISQAATTTATGVTLTISNNVPATVSGSVSYYGYTLRETSGSAGATVVVRDASATGTILDEITLTAGAHDREFYGPQGLRSESGVLLVTVVSGAVEGSLRAG